MDYPKLTYAEILKRSFIGKDAVEGAIKKITELDSFVRVGEIKDCKEFIRRYEGFLERTRPDTEHKSYLLAMTEKMLLLLRKSPECHCARLEVLEQPNAIYGVYYVIELDTIIGAIKGYDLPKTSPAEWSELWGNKPA